MMTGITRSLRTVSDMYNGHLIVYNKEGCGKKKKKRCGVAVFFLRPHP